MSTKTANPGKDTSEQILEAALALFRERGFASATMRDIAAKAGVASGLAYYYFDSKEAIVLAFYQRAREDMAPLLEKAHEERTLAGRLQALVEAKFAYFTPNRRFLGAILGHAADPASPLSPFNEASRPIREFEFAQFDRALQETRTRVPRDLTPHLSKMLWFYQMGLLLFWIHDRSPDQRRAHELLKSSLRAVVLLIKLSNVPLFAPARRSALNIIELLDA
ncbi:MAG TPA: TetR family transcriptional regulator [Vicinamibacterales bacterium]|nr:TetR family transcriptional regulator [Vicinamibacterales bacterium]